MGSLPNYLSCRVIVCLGVQLSVHRRGNRRIWYRLKRKPEAAVCNFCGMAAPRGTFSLGNPVCTGACMGRNGKAYPEEYKPPC